MQRLTLAGTLMFQDIPCFEFAIEDDICTKFEVLCDNYNYFPYGCDPSAFKNYKQNLVIFFYDRTTPPERQFIEEELKEIGLKYYDMSALILYQHGLAQDPYWVRLDTGPQTMKEAYDSLGY